MHSVFITLEGIAITVNHLISLVIQSIVNMANGDKDKAIPVQDILKETNLEETTLINVLEILEKRGSIKLSNPFYNGINVNAVFIK